MDIMGLWLLTGLSAGSSMFFFSVFGGRRSKGREIGRARLRWFRVHLARERLSSLAVFHCRDELIQLNPCSTHFL